MDIDKIKFKLNKRPLSQEDIHYFEGARLGIELTSNSSAFVFSGDGRNYLTQDQIKSLKDRGYYPEPILN